MPTLLLVLVDRLQIRIPLIPVGKRFFKKSVTKNFNSGFLSCFTPLVSAVRAAVVRATRARWAAPGATTLACVFGKWYEGLCEPALRCAAVAALRSSSKREPPAKAAELLENPN